MQELADAASGLDARLADPALYAAGRSGEARELTAERARVAQQTSEVETEWLELSEQLESATRA